jgi:hypothetical protein
VVAESSRKACLYWPNAFCASADRKLAMWQYGAYDSPLNERSYV